MKVILKNLAGLLMELLVFAILFVTLLLILLAGVQWITGNPFSDVRRFTFNEETSPYRLIVSAYLPLLISGLAASAITHHYLFDHPYSGLGYTTRRWLPMLARGWMWSLGLVIPGFLILWWCHQLRVLPPDWNGLYFFGFILFFIIQSGGEEILTRSYLINLVESRFGGLPALVLSASVFAFMHLGNDHFTWIGFINILLGGFLMALFFFRYRNIWICTGLHAGWNFVQASLLDFNVSGVDVYSFIQFNDTGYPRLTGAAFGYEGSLLAVLIQSLALIYFIRTNKQQLKSALRDRSRDIPAPVDLASNGMSGPKTPEFPGV